MRRRRQEEKRTTKCYRDDAEQQSTNISVMAHSNLKSKCVVDPIEWSGTREDKNG